VALYDRPGIITPQARIRPKCIVNPSIWGQTPRPDLGMLGGRIVSFHPGCASAGDLAAPGVSRAHSTARRVRAPLRAQPIYVSIVLVVHRPVAGTVTDNDIPKFKNRAWPLPFRISKSGNWDSGRGETKPYMQSNDCRIVPKSRSFNGRMDLGCRHGNTVKLRGSSRGAGRHAPRTLL